MHEIRHTLTFCLPSGTIALSDYFYRVSSLAAIAVCAIAERVLMANFHSSFETCIPHHQDCRS